jgi:CYTH domain-containing protein/predicted ATPase
VASRYSLQVSETRLGTSPATTAGLPVPVESLLDADDLAVLGMDDDPHLHTPYEIVITGGPCAGKTTAMAILKQKLADYGFKVLICPETATLAMSSGLDVVGFATQGDPKVWFEVQRQILRTQRALRERYRAFAGLYAEPVVILFDRGEMDNAAYIDSDLYSALLEEERLSLYDVRDSYDLVVHLVTAADGAEAGYTLANNTTRSESPELARELDQKTLAAWVGHPRLRIIDNRSVAGFDEKMNLTLRTVLKAVGRPAPLEIERKFLLATPPDLTALAHLHPRAVEIEQTYLLSPDPRLELRVRRRSQQGQSAYYRTEKVVLEPGKRFERERILTPSEYWHSLTTADPTRQPVKKTRYCFPYQSLYFELDHIEAPEELWVLEVELTEDSQEVVVPDGLTVAREVTGELAYTNAEIARRASRKSA